MAHLKPKKLLLTALVVGLGLSGSLDWTPTEGLFGGAEARVGRASTPVSVAGVARRTTRPLAAAGPRRADLCELRAFGPEDANDWAQPGTAGLCPEQPLSGKAGRSPSNWIDKRLRLEGLWKVRRTPGLQRGFARRIAVVARDEYDRQ